MKSIIVAAFCAATTFAAKKDFPSFDAMHANCAMQVSYKGQSCSQVFTNLEAKLKTLTPEPSAGGVYTIREENSGDYIWTNRETPSHHYIDDIIFEFSNSGSDCVVKSKSRSQTLSYYDYETNYCNMYNPHRYLGGFSDLTTSECKWVPAPADVTTTCDKY